MRFPGTGDGYPGGMASIEDPIPTDADERVDVEDGADALDEEVVGAEEPIDYPPDRPLGVEDPSVSGDDDVVVRDWRTEDEFGSIPDEERYVASYDDRRVDEPVDEP